MGTWGAALFSDDLAADVRGDLRDRLGDGLSADEATARLIADHGDTLRDPEQAPVFWFAVAATLWKLGVLSERARTEAMKHLDSGADLERWERDAPGQVAKRRKVLEELRAQLQSPQPVAKRVPKRQLAHTDLELGDVATYRLPSGSLTLMRVVDFHEDKGGRFPVYDVLDWCAPTPPDAATLAALGQRLPRRHHTGRFMLMQYRGNARPPLAWEKFGRHPGPIPRARPMERSTTMTVTFWKVLDSHLAEAFELR